MCGLAGGVFYKYKNNERQAIVKKMSDTLLHRGPNDDGTWCDNESPLALAHRRLSIIDTSNDGHQPMSSANNRWVIVFNGEIYNYQDIKRELILEGVSFRSDSDTEVLLEGIATWGVKNTLLRCHGMFALCVYDKHKRKVWLSRDRLGEKPLYYGWWNDNFVFASELKAIKAIPSFDAGVDRNALALYLRHNYIPAPYSIYQGIKKLLPGNIFSFDIDRPHETEKTRPYWRLDDVIGKRDKSLSIDDQQENFEKCLRRTIKQQLHADVPVGAFLSGGVDSSTIVALMSEESSQTVKTFSIGFDDEKYNEAKYASVIARHLGTDHSELYVTSQDALDVVQLLPNVYDEPFADSSQIPTYLVMQLAKQHVTVALSGDGGDELFGGYERYRWADRFWTIKGCLPRWVCGLSSTVLNRLPQQFYYRNLQVKGRRVANLLNTDTKESLYRELVSHDSISSSLLLEGKERPYLLTESANLPEFDSYLEYMMYADTLVYLPDDILTKVDRASMAVSIETRVPLLDHTVVEAAWQFSHKLDSNNDKSKMPIRNILYKTVPKQLIERPKKGFAVPLGNWLRGPLKSWASELLSPYRLQQEGYFATEKITAIWLEHLSGKGNWQYMLWNILMFQSWLDSQKQ